MLTNQCIELCSTVNHNKLITTPIEENNQHEKLIVCFQLFKFNPNYPLD